MNIDVEFHIRHNYPWSKLPANVRQGLGNSQREYEKQVVLYILIQGHGMHGMGEIMHIPFPFDELELQGELTRVNLGVHKALQTLREKVDLEHLCGYVTMLNASSHHAASRKLSDASDEKGRNFNLGLTY